MTCFSLILLLIAFLFVMVSLIRWFEQVTEAVENRWWNKALVLVVAPFAVWFYPGRVSAGRPTPVPRHEPVRGFGSVGSRAAAPAEAGDPKREPSVPVSGSDQPTPGTPKEFLGIPQVPPSKPKRPKSEADADQVAKLRQKMREQGMLPPDGE